MTADQLNVFKAATLNRFDAGDLRLLMTSVFWALMLLWAAWTLIQLARGWWSGALAAPQMGGLALRLGFVIMLVGTFIR